MDGKEKISFKRFSPLTAGKHREMELALQNYAKTTQPSTLSDHDERMTLTKALWKIRSGVQPTDTRTSIPPLDPLFKRCMMGTEKCSKNGQERGALRTYWSSHAVPFRIEGCAIERAKENPDPSKKCWLRQTRVQRRNNDLRNICPHCNLEAQL